MVKINWMSSESVVCSEFSGCGNQSIHQGVVEAALRSEQVRAAPHLLPTPVPCFQWWWCCLFSGLTSPNFVPTGSWIFLGGSNSLISGRKCCRLAVMGAVEGYIIFFSGNWWGRGGRREKFWSSQMPEFFDVSESLCLKRISPHITGELYPNRFVLKEFNLEIASERHLWAIWVISAIIRM